MTAAIHEFSPAQPRYPEPKPIIGQQVAEPYPIDSFPPLLRNAVVEVQAYVQAPMALVGSSALAIASLATQGLARVRRDTDLVGALSLYMLMIGEPSERKSQIEKYFYAPVGQWEAKQIALGKAKREQYHANDAVWKAKKRGLERRIEKAVKDDDRQAQESAAKEMLSLMESLPKEPMLPKFRYVDGTIPAIIDGLFRFPVGGVLTGEGGSFFGGAGMFGDSLTNALAKYNDLWSGESIVVDRKGDGSMVLANAAFSMSVAVQPDTLDKFIKKTNGAARGSGFMARQLIAMPLSTQGWRPYKPPPKEWVALGALHERITELLDLLPERIDENNKLKRVMLNLSPPAFELWTRYYNATEAAQQVGGDAEFIRPESGRSADNAARIAAIFHVLEHGLDGDISRDHMEMACRLASWHLKEAKRFLFASEMPSQFSNAEEVSKRITAYIRKRKAANMPDWNIITRRDILRDCKVAGVQDTKTLNPVIDELLEADHLLNRENVGRSQVITVNPRLLEVVP